MLFETPAHFTSQIRNSGSLHTTFIKAIWAVLFHFFIEFQLFLKHSPMEICAGRSIRLTKSLRFPDSQFMFLDLLKSNSPSSYPLCFVPLSFIEFQPLLKWNPLRCGILLEMSILGTATRRINPNHICRFSSANSNVRTFATAIHCVFFRLNLLNFASC
jgi:hypothetical protein